MPGDHLSVAVDNWFYKEIELLLLKQCYSTILQENFDLFKRWLLETNTHNRLSELFKLAYLRCFVTIYVVKLRQSREEQTTLTDVD